MAQKIIEIKSKKSGTSYLYEDESYWNKEKGYSPHKRKCIGKLSPEGKPIYNEYYKTREKINDLMAVSETKNPGTVSSTTFAGETFVLDKVSSKTGITGVLIESFAENEAKRIIALAYYRICRGKALLNADDWLDQRGYGGLHLNSQRVFELLERLKEVKINTFFKGWGKKHAEGGNQLFDLTGISTYGKRNPYAEYGYNRDMENLEQYRERNGVELYFDDEKNLLDLRRLKNHHEQTIRGKIFVTFVSLIIPAQLRKMVKEVEAKKRKYWSGQNMPRKVETYAKVHFEGKYKDVYTTPTAAQRLVLDIFGIEHPHNKGSDGIAVKNEP